MLVKLCDAQLRPAAEINLTRIDVQFFLLLDLE